MSNEERIIRTAWRAKNERCTNRAKDSNPRYGGRGIKVCKRWRESLEAFYADMGDRPRLEHTLDGIDNDGNYKPTNCKWSTRTEQAMNRTKHRRRTAVHTGRPSCKTADTARTFWLAATRGGTPAARLMWRGQTFSKGRCGNMHTIIQYGIGAGEWIVGHTLVPYPVGTTVVLLAVNVAIVVLVAVDVVRRRR
jgi:hypothetical protein